MDNSPDSLTLATRHFSPSCEKTPRSLGKSTVSGTKVSSEKIRQTLLTPCRRMGLKRKSVSLARNQLFKHACGDSSPCSPCNKTENCESNNLKKSATSVYRVDSVAIEETKRNFHNDNIVECIDTKNSDSCNESERSEIVIKNKQSSKKDIDKECMLYTLKTNDVLSYNEGPVTLERLEILANGIKQKKEKYKHIKLSMLYEKKHDLRLLKELTGKWKQGCQNALTELQSLFKERGHSVTMSQLLSQFQISPNVIGYDEDTDEFQ